MPVSNPSARIPGDTQQSRTSAVRATQAVKRYGVGPTAVTALDALDIAIPRGQFAAILGASGSGKSTLLHCLAGLDRLDDGKVLLDGVNLGGLSDKQLTILRRSKVGFVFQAFNLIPTLSVEDNIKLPLQLAGDKVDEAWFAEIVGTLGIADRLAHRPSELSGGQQQRAAVARALVTRPTIIFADEPTGNLDSVASSELLTMLRKAADDFGQTIVMVTHEPVAAAFADRAVFLQDGTVVADLESPTADAVLDQIKAIGS